ncbi:MAG: PIN domain-containing protein [Candidatus Protochlamydia sp.]|nr:PIN domain-containing protein [Candidatus Protochlamydia sp.]
MNVLIDTSIWSLVLRRNQKINENDLTKIVADLIQDFRVRIIGPIRQEILSGISNENHCLKIQEILRSFEDLVITSFEYERAAEMFNICRKNGIQGSHIDFLICAAAERYGLSIFTSDNDFKNYTKYLPLHLFKPTI